MGQIPWREVGGRAVVLQPLRGEVHEFNETACLLWTLIDGTLTIAEIARILAQDFEIDESSAQKDALTFYTELAEKNLIQFA